jgi:hypothetical protein
MREIKIGGHVMELKTGKCPKHFRKKAGKFQGLAIFPLNEIYLSDRIAPSKQASVFLHEVLEHLKDLTELEFTHNQLSCLAEQLYQVLVDNPEIVKKLLRREALV